MCIALGRTMEELGDLKKSDPVFFDFLEEAFAERLRRKGVFR